MEKEEVKIMWGKKKLSTPEYLELKKELETLKIQLNSLTLDLELYVKKLKLSKGIRKLNDESEDLSNSVILKSDGTSQIGG